MTASNSDTKPDTTDKNACPCGTGKPLAACCEPFLLDKAAPPTAEALMRSRYTAYTQGNIDYIIATHAAPAGDEVDRELTAKWANESEWLGLEIVSTERGQDGDDDGVVEFRARYRARKDKAGELHVHHERSRFQRKDGRWKFIDGAPVKGTPVRAAATAGRNDPCPCGSGKKFKRCHGA